MEKHIYLYRDNSSPWGHTICDKTNFIVRFIFGIKKMNLEEFGSYIERLERFATAHGHKVDTYNLKAFFFRHSI